MDKGGARTDLEQILQDDCWRIIMTKYLGRGLFTGSTFKRTNRTLNIGIILGNGAR